MWKLRWSVRGSVRWIHTTAISWFGPGYVWGGRGEKYKASLELTDVSPHWTISFFLSDRTLLVRLQMNSVFLSYYGNAHSVIGRSEVLGVPLEQEFPEAPQADEIL